MLKDDNIRFIKPIKSQNPRNTFILLNAGQGRRTKNYGNKCLIEYQNKRIIDHQIDIIKKCYGNNCDIIVVSGFMSNKLVKELPHVRIVENINYNKYHIVESMRLGINASLEGNIFFIHGDLVFTQSFISIPNYRKAYVPIDRRQRIGKDETGVVFSEKKGTVSNFAYGIPDKWCQISFFPVTEFYNIKTVLNRIDKKFSSFEFLNLLIKKKMNIHYFESNKGKIKEIDSIRDTYEI
jgi:choline kinase